MRFMNCSARTVVALLGLSCAALARAELPELHPVQVLSPALEDLLPDFDNGSFGDDVVIKGNLAIVGMPNANGGIGRALVHVRDATGKWVRRAALTVPGLAPGANFGKAVAVSGRRAVIGSSTAVYTFESVDNKWRQGQTLFFGKPIKVSDIDFEGNLVAIGVGASPGNNGVHVFVLRDDGLFHAITRTTATDVQANDQFGFAVALNGTTLAVTAPGYNGSQGAAYVYACTDTGCTRKQKLIANDGEPGDRFGASVDVLGNTLAIGATAVDSVFEVPGQNTSETNFTAQGAGYVYVRSSSTGNAWTETQKLRITPQENNSYLNLGFSVALSTNRIVIGAPYGPTAAVPGKLFVYAKTGGMYVATHGEIGALGLGDCVSLSGTQLLSGAPLEFLFRGVADVFSVP